MDASTWEWIYRTLIDGHEGPILALLILLVGGILVMAWKGWLRIGPPEKDIKQFVPAKMAEETRQHLYQIDGTSKYVPRSECAGSQQECQSHLCGKIDEVKALVVAANRKVDVATKERNEELRTIAEFMGGTKEAIETAKKEISDMRAAILMLAKDQRG